MGCDIENEYLFKELCCECLNEAWHYTQKHCEQKSINAVEYRYSILLYIKPFKNSKIKNKLNLKLKAEDYFSGSLIEKHKEFEIYRDKILAHMDFSEIQPKIHTYKNHEGDFNFMYGSNWKPMNAISSNPYDLRILIETVLDKLYIEVDDLKSRIIQSLQND
ncbi:hypothetical protein SDA20_03305 [Legionella pneumophila serogroup 1]|nr:hypothetical protein [Legionella pneumophila]HDO9973308.1 hypothetical protein [Legionella pneumophila]